MTTHAATGPAPELPDWRRNATMLFLANLTYTTGFTIFYPYLPLIVRELGVSGPLETWVGYIVGGIFVLTFLLTPVWGGLADHYGKKSMVLRAGLGIGVVFVLSGVAPSMAWFFPVVLWVGVFNGFVAATLALTAATTPLSAMGRALATVQNGAHIGATLGPAAAVGLVALLASHQHLFFVCAALTLTGGLVTLFLVHEPHAAPEGPLRLHLVRDLLDCLRLPGMGPLYLLQFVFSTVFFGNITVMSIYTLHLAPQPYLGLTAGQWVGIVNLAITIASAASLPVWGRLLDRFRPTAVLAAGLVLALGSAVPVPLLGNPLQLTVARATLGLLGSGIMPAVVRMIKERAPVGMDARALSFGTSLYMLGHGGAPLLAGWISPVLGLRAYFWLNVAMLVGGLLLTARVARGEGRR